MGLDGSRTKSEAWTEDSGLWRTDGVECGVKGSVVGEMRKGLHVTGSRCVYYLDSRICLYKKEEGKSSAGHLFGGEFEGGVYDVYMFMGVSN